MNNSGDYRPSDIAFIIPTKDRPGKIRDLLDSFLVQEVSCGRIIIVDSGKSIRDLVLEYRPRLPVEYFRCHPPGQIRQRNLGISKIDARTPLVGSLDDDIVLEPEALESMVDFWNRCLQKPAGVSFNIVNVPEFRYSFLKAFFAMGSERQGRVLRSGYNVATTPAIRNLKTDWLSGGATVWRSDIIRKFQHREISSRWAICEDVIFSYPLGKRFPLYVCADARVRHEHVYDHAVKRKNRYYGQTISLWRLYFVESNPDLSRLFFLWMSFGQILMRLVMGALWLRPDELEYAVGQSQGIVRGMTALVKGKDLLTILNEDT